MTFRRVDLDTESAPFHTVCHGEIMRGRCKSMTWDASRIGMVFANHALPILGEATHVYQDSNATSDLAAVILRYISSRPDACDTLEGVSEWWLARQRYEDSYAGVATALDLLIDRGLAEATRFADGRVVYRAIERGPGGRPEDSDSASKGQPS